MTVRLVIVFIIGMLAGAAVLALVSGAAHENTNGATSVSAPNEARPIAPADFVVAPCARAIDDGEPCLIVAAGGKRVLIGAPAGVGDGRLAGETLLPDAVLLFSLHAKQIEGLDEVRSRVWNGQRRRPLTVAATMGIERVVGGLDAAYILPDALAYAEGEHRGGFDVTPLQARAVGAGDTAFDTGDLRIVALVGGPERLAFLVSYEDQLVLLAGCGARAGDVARWPAVDAYFGCDLDEYPGTRLGDWPLRSSHYLTGR